MRATMACRCRRWAGGSGVAWCAPCIHIHLISLAPEGAKNLRRRPRCCRRRVVMHVQKLQIRKAGRACVRVAVPPLGPREHIHLVLCVVCVHFGRRQTMYLLETVGKPAQRDNIKSAPVGRVHGIAHPPTQLRALTQRQEAAGTVAGRRRSSGRGAHANRPRFLGGVVGTVGGGT